METCHFCRKGILEDKKVTVDFRWGNKLIVIERVPAKVCSECGERYYSAEVSKQMEKIALEGKEEETIEVPLVRLSEVSSTVEANKQPRYGYISMNNSDSYSENTLKAHSALPCEIFTPLNACPMKYLQGEMRSLFYNGEGHFIGVKPI